MIIYGYTRICNKGTYSHRESETLLFPDNRRERDKMMYQDYSDTFDTMAQEGKFGGDGAICDTNNTPKMMEEEFMAELTLSKDEGHEVFGYIQACDCRIQFEPFTKTL